MSALSMLLIGMLIGVFAGAAIGRYVDPQRQQNMGQEASLKKAQDELANYRQQVREHFSQAAALIQTLSDQAKTVHDHIALDALKLSGLDLRPAAEQQPMEYELAKLASSQPVEPPKDYALNRKGVVGTLSEEYGLRDDLDEEPKVSSQPARR